MILNVSTGSEVLAVIGNNESILLAGALYTGRYFIPPITTGFTVWLFTGTKFFPLILITWVALFGTLLTTTLFLNTALYIFGITESGM